MFTHPGPPRRTFAGTNCTTPPRGRQSACLVPAQSVPQNVQTCVVGSGKSLRLIISLAVLALACAGFCASAGAQQPYPLPPPGYYPLPPGYYPQRPPPGYYPPASYTPAPPQPYSDGPPPPGGPPPGYGRDASGGPVQPYYPYRQGAGNPPPGYYPPPGAPQRTTSVEGLPPDEQPEQGPRMDRRRNFNASSSITRRPSPPAPSSSIPLTRFFI